MEATSLRSANIEHLIEFIGFHFASRLESRRRWGRFSMRKGGASYANRNRSCDRRLVQFAFSKTKMLCAKWGFNYFKHLWKLRAESGREKRFHFCIKARKIMWSHYGLFCFFLHLEHSWNNCEHFCSSNNRKKFKSRSCFRNDYWNKRWWGCFKRLQWAQRVETDEVWDGEKRLWALTKLRTKRRFLSISDSVWRMKGQRKSRQLRRTVKSHSNRASLQL